MKRTNRWCVLMMLSLVLGSFGRLRADADPVIKDLRVEGNRFLRSRTVLSKVKAKAGDTVTDPAFRADIDRLFETGLYDDVEVSLEDVPGEKTAQGAPKVRVVFKIKERPVVRRIDFKGNRRLSDSKFREELSSKSDEPYDRFKAGQDVQKIVAKYREEGYAEAQAESYVSLNPRTNKVILTFFVTEGNRVLVDAVRVEGNRFMTARKVRGRLKKTRRKKVFKEDTYKEDIDHLIEAYRDQGFLEVQVDASSRTFSEDHTRVTLTLGVREGRRYTVGGIAFAGATLYKDAELAKAVALRSGKLYEQSRMNESLRSLQDLYADKGYLRAEIDPQTVTHPVDDSQGTVDVTFAIVESSVVYVDRVYVDGNTYTKENVVRREVLLKPGDVFSAGKMRRSVERIYNLGFLDDVQVDIQQPRSPSLADVVFSVKEGKPGILSAGAGFSSLDGVVGTLQVQHINLFGLGQRLNLMWEFGRKKQNYEIGWTDPWFLNKPVSFGVDLFDTVRTLPFQNDSFAYKKGNRGFGLRLGPRLSDELSLIENYNYERVRVFDIEPKFIGNDDPANNIAPSDDIKSAVTTGVVWDTRDNVFDASRGGRHSATVEVAGGPFGGDLNFYKPELSVARYFPTFWKFVLTLSVRGAFVKEFPPSKELPFSELFRVGGVDTVRGYDIGEVGVDGGHTYMVYNAEYKFPIVQESHRTILQGAFFADVGGSWAGNRDVNLGIGSRLNQMRSGVGFGVRFKTPVFPIRLDWGYGLNHLPGQPLSQFYFTIGNIF
ncbi:MAG: outer membrane protein assembly factor BamA [Elusimicrobia bacterium]|nr:outer membrane protein assembly factor BamA [Elusimicrobiota bacterium]